MKDRSDEEEEELSCHDENFNCHAPIRSYTSKASSFPKLSPSKNKTVSIEEIIEDLIRKAKKKNIDIRVLALIYEQYKKTDIKRSIFKYAINTLQELINKAELPRYIEEHELIQLMLDGNYYLKQGDSGFQRAKEELYGGIIYDIICKFPLNFSSDFSGKHYIGRTHKSKFERMMEHIEASLNVNVSHSPKIQQAIIFAVNQEFDIDQFWEDYQLMSSERKRRILENITKILLKKYFDLNIIEIHKNYYTTIQREKWYIENYEHYVNGKLTKGTKNPNGLNMVTSGGFQKYIHLPLYDIAFMITIGYRPKMIAEMLNKKYILKIDRLNLIINNRIRDFWHNWENAQEIFLKPIIQN